MKYSRTKAGQVFNRGTRGHEISVERGIQARELREKHDLTRPMLSDLISRSERSIYRWETEGISEENYRLIEEAVKAHKNARTQSVSGFSRRSMEALHNISTIDLALELVSRARAMEQRNRSLDELKEKLEREGLGYLIPEDF